MQKIIGKITGYNYININSKWQDIINKTEEYANEKFNEHKEQNTSLYQKAYFEVWHNHCYDKISKEAFDELIRKEFIYICTEKIILDKIKI